MLDIWNDLRDVRADRWGCQSGTCGDSGNHAWYTSRYIRPDGRPWRTEAIKRVCKTHNVAAPCLQSSVGAPADVTMEYRNVHPAVPNATIVLVHPPKTGGSTLGAIFQTRRRLYQVVSMRGESITQWSSLVDIEACQN